MKVTTPIPPPHPTDTKKNTKKPQQQQNNQQKQKKIPKTKNLTPKRSFEFKSLRNHNSMSGIWNIKNFGL